MRQMPSVTETTVPWLRMSALAAEPFDAALDQFGNFCGIELHDSFLCLGVSRQDRLRSGRQRDFHLFQAGLDRGVEHLVADHHANAADQRRVFAAPSTLSLRPNRFSSAADHVGELRGVDRERAVDDASRRRRSARSRARGTAPRSPAARPGGRCRSPCAGSSCRRRRQRRLGDVGDDVEHLLVA